MVEKTCFENRDPDLVPRQHERPRSNLTPPNPKSDPNSWHRLCWQRRRKNPSLGYKLPSHIYFHFCGWHHASHHPTRCELLRSPPTRCPELNQWIWKLCHRDSG